ncbi:hypothetical protein GCM10009117_02450 [Gangjinia marincola]|uniref:Antitoxin Xre/MbcA/ParS-like toxin-binding domain-containing protein n=1 Tax=Gangjinia marincola TaxID=578463 RepID=A0ABP3XP49_9FLAO
MTAQASIIQLIPEEADPTWIISYLEGEEFTARHVEALKVLSTINVRELAHILGITPKTFTVYTKDATKVKIDTKEHILLLLSLIKKGTTVFGDAKVFHTWLTAPNVFFDRKKPLEFLRTISGIRFVDHRLTAMEYGDNV